MNKQTIYGFGAIIIALIVVVILCFGSCVGAKAETPDIEIVESIEPVETIEPIIEETEPEVEIIPTEPEPPKWYPEMRGITWYSDFRTTALKEPTTTAGGAEFDIEFLAKLLYCEAGSMDWTGQVYVCSAILNFCDVEDVDLWTAGHTTRMFAVAPYVDGAVPLEMQYEVIEYVLGGGRVIGVNYFRTNHYHYFGTPVCKIENVYFSK
jgi:hypothetical protein